MTHIRRLDEMSASTPSYGTIARQEFREKIRWTPANTPHSVNSLKLVNGDSVVSLGGAKISGKYFSIYYWYDALSDKANYPIVFTNGDARLTVNSTEELDEWAEKGFPLSSMREKAEVKKEYLRGAGKNEIRQDEVRHRDRLPFKELYDYDTDELIGYVYIEI